MKYLAYCRKSQESEDRQIMSLDSQETELQRLSERDGLEVVKVFKESMSAKEIGRPLFEDMLSIIQKGKARGLLCWKLDRLARNPIDGGKIIWLLQKGIIQEIRTPERVYLPTDNVLLMYVEFGMANQYSRDLRQNVMRGNKTKLEKGGWPNMAPLGYLNDKANRSIILDPERAKYVQKIFELYATGGYSLLEVTNILFEAGFRTRSGKKVSRGYIHNLIKNPFPTGIMEKNGKYYPGNHEPIISKELFDQANAVLSGNMRPKKKTHSFHLRGFLKCASCGCMLTAAKKKGHDYYYCTNGKGNCEEHKKYLRAEKLDELVAETLTKLQSDPEWVDLAYEAAKIEGNSDNRYFETALLSLQNTLRSNREKQSRFADSYAAEITPEAIYAEENAYPQERGGCDYGSDGKVGKGKQKQASCFGTDQKSLFTRHFRTN